MVSIIILSFNTEKLLDGCLSSVKQMLKTSSYEVIVVDNASSDASCGMIEKKYPWVKLIKSKENLGFGNGINLGATKAKGEYLLFLNSDAEIKTDGLKDIVSFFEKEVTCGIIGGRLENKDGSYQRSFSNFYGIKDIFLMLFGGDKLETSLYKGDKGREVDWVSGGCMFIRKDIFDKLQGFDKQIFMYIEDMELCFRVRKAGYSIFFNPSFVVKHLGYGSSNREFAIVNIYKGLIYFYKKHKSLFAYYLVKLLLTVKAVLALTLGMVLRKKELVSTYKKALRYSL